MSMNKKYFICIDLDGTLLQDDKTISETSKEYLRRLEDDGHKVVLTSGRALRSVKKYYKDIGLKTSPVITYNGHLSMNFDDENKYETKHIISKNTAKALYSLIVPKFAHSVMSENIYKIYIDQDDPFLFDFFEKDDLEIVTGPLDKNINEDVLTFVFKIDNDIDLRAKMKELVESTFKDIKVRYWDGDMYGEIYEDNVSKARAISEVSAHYGFSKNEVIIFGDANNDIEMLRDFENSFVMKNGHLHLRKLAHSVTEFTNNEDGVIKALDKFLKEN